MLFLQVQIVIAMDEITKLSYNAISRYFTSLSQFGYKNYNDVNKLLALLALDDMLNIFSEYIDENDLKSIVNAIYCLSGTTCLIDFPSYFNNNTLFHKTKINYIARISEDSILRIDEGSLVRVVA